MQLDFLYLTEKYGTPLYVYDGNVIESQYHRLVNAIGISNLKINYACKALTNISILKLIKSLGGGLDAVSLNEVKLGLLAGFSPEDIMYTPNGVSLSEIQAVKKLGVNINIDNLEMLAKLAEVYPGIKLGFRINPHIVAGGNRKIQVGHIDSKFGISIHHLQKLKDLVQSKNIQVQGIHMHTGSDILDIEVFLQSVDILFNAASQFPDLEYVDFGSGFKVKYKPDDYATDIEAFGEGIKSKYEAWSKAYGKEVKIIFEPGKFLVSEAGTFLVKTNVVKHGVNSIFVHVDSGQNHLIRPMFYDAYHHIDNISNPNGPPHYYHVVGYICETDTFAYNRPISEVREGDILAFRNTGAYCFMMANNYNSRLLPAEVLLYNERDYLIRSRQEFDDLLSQIEQPNISFNT